MNISLHGKLALVTGASGGIGQAAATSLAGCGARVAVHYFNNQAGVEETLARISALGSEAHAFQADLTDIAQIESMTDAIERTFGDTVDILINNAGHLVKRQSNEEMTEELYNQIMDVNLKTTVFMTKAVLPGMRAKKAGKIVNCASLAAHNGGGPGASVYAASKAAVLAYTKGLAKETAAYGVQANTISPGFIGQTAFHATFTPDDARLATIKTIPLGREGAPQDVANTILFLVSELSDYLTGETIEINGGMFMR